MKKLNEKGQALIVVAIAAVALFGFAALAIDGSRVFSEKRQAQNAADSAVLASALAKTRGNAWKPDGFASALINGFNNDTTTNEVYVESCADVACPGLPAGAISSEYVYVKIVIHVTTTFARVVGQNQIDQAVEAVARSVPSYVDEMVYGNAVVALNRTGCKAFWGHGNADFTTKGGGVFVNSNASCGFTLSGGPNLNTPSITIAGSTSSPVIGGANYNASQLPYPPMTLPNPSCDGVTAVKTGNTLSPGIVNGSFPPSGVTHLQGGVFCVNGNFSLNGNDTLTGSNIVIRMDSGDITWNGNGTLDLAAPTVGPFKGLLIYVPLTNTSTIRINGTNDQKLTGTILAPSSDIVLLGTAGTDGFNSQIIGYNVEFGGTFNGTIRYDDEENYDASIPPTIELIK